MGSLVAELAEKLSSATNNFDIDSGTIYVNTSADTVGIGTTTPGSKLDVQGTMQVGVNDTGHDVKFFGATAGAYLEWDESADELEIRGGAATPGKLLLSTAETTVVDGNKLGQIDFQAPLDSAGTDAILVGASIYAEADATFSSSVNATELVFATGASEAAAEKMRITSDGKVGIGTTSPETPLAFEPSSVTSATEGIKFQNSDNASDAIVQPWKFYDGIGLILGSNLYMNTSGNVDRFNSSEDSAGVLVDPRGKISFYTGGTGADATLATTIDSSGKVGIGTDAPDTNALLHMQTSNDNYHLLIESTDAGVSSPGFGINLYRNSASPADSDLLSSIKYTGRNDNSQDVTYAVIYGQISDASDGTEDGALRIQTMVAGTSTDTLTANAGKVGIGTTSPFTGSLLGLYKSGANAEMLIHNLKAASGSRYISAINFLTQNNDNYASWSTWTSTDSAPSFNISYDADEDSIGTTPYLTISDAGNVGIGTTSFTSTAGGRTILELNGSSTSLFNISVGGTRQGYLYHDTSNMYLYNVQNNDFIFGTNDTERMRLSSNGRLGIGVTSPNNQLDVWYTGLSGQNGYSASSVGTSSFNIVSIGRVLGNTSTLSSSIVHISWAGTNASDAGVMGYAVFALEKNFSTYAINNIHAPTVIHGASTGNLSFSLSSSYLSAQSGGYNFVQIKLSWAVLTNVAQA